MTYQERFIPYTAGRPDYDDRTANRAIRNVLEEPGKGIVTERRRRRATPLEQLPEHEVYQAAEEDPVEALIALKTLRARGAITKEDFVAKKTPLLEKLRSASWR